MKMVEETTTTIPDTYGLPEFFISDVVTEIDGPNVRMICGIKRGGAVHWLYSCVMRADLLVVGSRQVNAAAQEAFNLMQMMDRRRDH
ncbi:hypothetical protein ACFDR1_16840 [Bradyrhizobium sp. 1AS5L]